MHIEHIADPERSSLRDTIGALGHLLLVAHDVYGGHQLGTASIPRSCWIDSGLYETLEHRISIGT